MSEELLPTSISSSSDSQLLYEGSSQSLSSLSDCLLLILTFRFVCNVVAAVVDLDDDAVVVVVVVVVLGHIPYKFEILLAPTCLLLLGGNNSI